EQIDRICESVPGGAGNIQDIYPLAPLQEGMLFHYLMQEQGDVYVEPMILSFDTEDRLKQFFNAIQCVIDRHDVLRTALVWEYSPSPVQVVYRHVAMELETMTFASNQDALTELRLHFDPDRLRLNLQQAPIMRACSVNDDKNNRWLLCLIEHHIWSDRTTQQLLFKEVNTILEGQQDRLPDPVPFRLYVQNALSAAKNTQQEEVFTDMLSGFKRPSLPYAVDNILSSEDAVDHLNVSLDRSLSNAIRIQAQKAGVNPASIFHLAWARVVGFTSGTNDVVFGTVMLGRMSRDYDTGNAFGSYVNTLPIRVILESTTVKEALLDTYDSLAQLVQCELSPLVLAQGCSDVPVGEPLFTAIMNYRFTKDTDALLGKDSTDIRWDGIQVLDYKERTNYPVSLSVNDTQQDFSLDLTVSSIIRIDRMAEYCINALKFIVESLATNPYAALCEKTLMNQYEYSRVVNDNPAIDGSLNIDSTLLTSEQVALLPDIGSVNHAYILDSKCHPAPLGVLGELYLSSLKQNAKILSKNGQFCSDPFSGDDYEMLKTGFSGIRLEDGSIRLIGMQQEQEAVSDHQSVRADAALTALNTEDIPSGELEENLARIWCELLGVRQVNRGDHFFELGGHSLLTIRMISKIRTEIGLEISLKTLFENPVFADQAEIILNALLAQFDETDLLELETLLEDSDA
ncbi:condensation domain-containing protein, partial [Gynuella sp.]|uniref:condensation domain-containing protein n=1 Tax=Gynuella sp. TaxID=2969146 RepID=UPI003D0C6E74